MINAVCILKNARKIRLILSETHSMLINMSTAKMRAYKAAWARQARKNNPDKIRKYNMARYRECRNTWLAANGPCVKCGSTKRLAVDHIDPKTKIHHMVWTWSEHRRLAELAKCQVLCFICHRLKTNAERGWKTHGELMWQTGCRCPECIRVHAKKLRKLRRTSCL